MKVTLVDIINNANKLASKDVAPVVLSTPQRGAKHKSIYFKAKRTLPGDFDKGDRLFVSVFEEEGVMFFWTGDKDDYPCRSYSCQKDTSAIYKGCRLQNPALREFILKHGTPRAGRHQNCYYLEFNYGKQSFGDGHSYYYIKYKGEKNAK